MSDFVQKLISILTTSNSCILFVYSLYILGVKLMSTSVLIIGGGIGGLTAGALLSKTHNVTILESSNEWGGSAGKFSRGPFLFPVGATLGMGFEQGGVHDMIAQKLGLTFDKTLLEDVMQIHLPYNEAPITFKRNRQEHLQQLQQRFPAISQNLAAFFNEVWAIAEEIKYLMKAMPVMPPKTLQDWQHLFKAMRPKSLLLAKYYFKTIGELVKKHRLDKHQLFLIYLDGQLIDSMQTGYHNCSALIGALALDLYHTGAFYVEGGLYQVAHKLVNVIERDGVAYKKSKVVKVYKEANKWIAEDRKGNIYKADHIAFNIPLPNVQEIVGDITFSEMGISYVKQQKKPMWGTVTLYMAVKKENVPDDALLFHQVMANDNMEEGNHIFISLSKLGDLKRAPAYARTINVSTHTSVDHWLNLSKEQYKLQKQAYIDKMLTGVKQVFPQIEDGIIELIAGTPKSWETFTSRKHGIVGGYAQTNDQTLFRALSHRTNVKGLWLCGDSVFPGASTVGVSMSGYHVYKSIVQSYL